MNMKKTLQTTALADLAAIVEEGCKPSEERCANLETPQIGERIINYNMPNSFDFYLVDEDSDGTPDYTRERERL